MEESDFLALPYLELQRLCKDNNIIVDKDEGASVMVKKLMEKQPPKPRGKRRGGSRKIHLGKGKTTRKNRT